MTTTERGSGCAHPVGEAVGAVEKEAVERREVLRRFGVYAACTAPAMTVLLASRQAGAMGIRHKGGGGGGGGGKGGGCGFSC